MQALSSRAPLSAGPPALRPVSATLRGADEATSVALDGSRVSISIIIIVSSSSSSSSSSNSSSSSSSIITRRGEAWRGCTRAAHRELTRTPVLDSKAGTSKEHLKKACVGSAIYVPNSDVPNANSVT